MIRYSAIVDRGQHSVRINDQYRIYFRWIAGRLLISYPRMNEIVNGKRAVTPDTALRLGRFTGTEPEFWLNLQQAVDLWDTMHSDVMLELQEIHPAGID